jgi:hypothetical protein
MHRSVSCALVLAAALLTACDAPRAADGADGSDGAVGAVGAAAGTAPEPAADAEPQAAFLTNLAAHCGEHFPGRLTLRPQGDEMLTGTELLLVHFRDCDADEVRIPFHIEGPADAGADRSRTWYVIRHDDRLELRHDHRAADGSESRRTWYGGFTDSPGTATRQDFVSPERTAAAGVPVGWRIEMVPGVRYVYGTTRAGEYDWRIEFDLSRPLDGPAPLPWGHDRSPSRVPGPP